MGAISKKNLDTWKSTLSLNNHPVTPAPRNLTPTVAPSLTSPSATAWSIVDSRPHHTAASTTTTSSSSFLFIPHLFNIGFGTFSSFFLVFFVRERTSPSAVGGASLTYQFYKNSSHRDSFCTGTVISFLFKLVFRRDLQCRRSEAYHQASFVKSCGPLISLISPHIGINITTSTPPPLPRVVIQRD